MLAIAADEIHVWIARDEQITDPQLLESYWQLLDPLEREQQGKFYFPRHRHQYLITRALLRSVLSLYADSVPPSSWQFEKNAYGKPTVRYPTGLSLSFNLSHTEQMVVLAVSGEGAVGVDVERTQRKSEVLDIADHYFSPRELRQLRALPQALRHDRFFDLWTLKEAYIKACGMGLSIPLDHFSYLFADSGAVSIAFEAQRNDHPELWQFWQIEPGAPHKIALALRRDRPAVAAALSVRRCEPLRHFESIALPFVQHLP
jgi:4'-phosphopantetheinyl transferase